MSCSNGRIRVPWAVEPGNHGRASTYEKLRLVEQSVSSYNQLQIPERRREVGQLITVGHVS